MTSTYVALIGLRDLNSWPTALLQDVADYADFHFIVVEKGNSEVKHYVNGMFTHTSQLSSRHHAYHIVNYQNSHLLLGRNVESMFGREMLERYDCRSGKWSIMPMNPSAAFFPVELGATCVVFGSQIYIVGLQNDSSIWICNPLHAKVTQGPTLPETFYNPAVVHVNGVIYIMGGTDRVSNTCYAVRLDT